MEDWKTIKGYPNYLISNEGRVFSYKSNKFLKPGKGSRGYLIVVLCNNSVGKSHTIHRLVALAFIPNPENKLTVNHIDSVRTNNHVSNLEWTTYSENNQHGYDFGFIKPVKGSKNVQSKLTESQVKEIRSLYKTGEYTQTVLAKIFYVSQRLISNIVNRKKWVHI